MFFFIVISKLPFWFLYRISDIIFFLMYYAPGYRKKIVYDNLANSFPDKTKKELDNLAKLFYKNLADITVETLKIPNISVEEIRKRVVITNLNLLYSIMDEGDSTIVLTGHQCNWEWLLVASSAIVKYPIDAVYKPMEIVTLDNLFIKIRTRFGARPIAMKDVYRSIIAKKNETRVIAMVADQTPAHSEIQFFTNFLNQKTAFFVGAEKIARHTNYPVLFMEMKRIKRGFYEAEFHLLKKPPFDDTNFVVTKMYEEKLEECIRKNPENWLWSHRRWKYKEMKVNRKNNKDE